jgi:anthranilate synthase component 1
MTRRVLLAPPEVDDDAAELPPAFLGGWAGYAGYDSVRYAEPAKLPFDAAPPDDRGLPDVDFGFYPGAVVFDGVTKLVTAVRLALLPTEGNEDDAARAWKATTHALAAVVERLQRRAEPMRTGVMPSATRPGERAFDDDVRSNTTPAEHRAMVERAKEYIRAGDIFQVVVGQRFERRSTADPFDVYRALRALNPSPYMGYVQGRGCILVASSPEILCRVRAESMPTASDQTPRFTVTNRPLAGTRRRGGTPDEDAALEAELLADEKERAEHVMLVDLGRNDVGRVCEPGSVRLEALMDIERYSHVMHISSTVTGTLRAGLDCWDALRATLPVGTISGAPKIRAMQIIDELETAKRGPYGGGFGVAGLDGSMDIALALRTIVTPTGARSRPDDAWTYHLQAAGGIVFDSEPRAEYDETVNKASASAAAIKIAEAAFGARR